MRDGGLRPCIVIAPAQMVGGQDFLCANCHGHMIEAMYKLLCMVIAPRRLFVSVFVLRGGVAPVY